MQFLLVVAVLLCSMNASAQAQWTAELALGDAYDFRTDLEIAQGDYSRELTAKYETRAYEDPPYYSLRLARTEHERGWELQLVHHKLYLQNRPPEVSSLSISHGFNMVTINRAFSRGEWTYRAGAGPVITHAEADVNGVSYGGPYELCGAAVMTSIGRKFIVNERWHAGAELSATLAYAQPRPDGTPPLELRLWNAAVHLQVGIGLRLK